MPGMRGLDPSSPSSRGPPGPRGHTLLWARGEWGQHGLLRPHLSPSVDSDGAGRSGTYVLIDMVLNKMAKGKSRVGAAL